MSIYTVVSRGQERQHTEAKSAVRDYCREVNAEQEVVLLEGGLLTREVARYKPGDYYVHTAVPMPPPADFAGWAALTERSTS